MHSESRDHRYTLNLAETALEQIKSLELPGDPPSFEVWYTYAGRFIPALNQAINDALAKGQRLSAVDIDRIYDRHLGTFRLGEQVEKIGEEINSEVDQVVGMIDAAIGSADRYDSNLSNIGQKLDHSVDRVALRTIVEALVSETRSAATENRKHQSQLKAARNEIDQLRINLEAIRVESRTDALTALANRKQFDQSLNEAILHARQTSEPLTLLMCDADHFKAFNDKWGHPLGDDVLRLIARTIREVIRREDIAARYGGEEFAVIFPNTSLRAATEIAERFRTEVGAKQVVQRSTGRNLGRVTVSVGLAQWQKDETLRDIIERADACLYAAKNQGRNRVICQLPQTAVEPAEYHAA